MENQGSTHAAPLLEKHELCNQASGSEAGHMTQPQQIMYPPPSQAPPPYTTVPPVQYIIQTPQPLTNPPDDYLIQAILVTVFCFWPTGIIAIIKSLDSRRAAQMGDVQGAQLSSKAARKLSIISLIVGIAVLVIIAIIIAIEMVVIFTVH
ncbi:proline-rich transmembrane protein 1-like [Acanthaster planci]|uniref:Proline-rich transmembrane protein 1-like n=1 Tax=Acanthaster planci TaxID=133434 RepID=A0A8B8A177_ACAPL|nr:proline-rich transmembrane protein 1-like [Acanthaster planci]